MGPTYQGPAPIRPHFLYEEAAFGPQIAGSSFYGRGNHFVSIYGRPWHGGDEDTAKGVFSAGPRNRAAGQAAIHSVVVCMGGRAADFATMLKRHRHQSGFGAAAASHHRCRGDHSKIPLSEKRWWAGRVRSTKQAGRLALINGGSRRPKAVRLRPGKKDGARQVKASKIEDDAHHV